MNTIKGKNQGHSKYIEYHQMSLQFRERASSARTEYPTEGLTHSEHQEARSATGTSCSITCCHIC